MLHQGFLIGGGANSFEDNHRDPHKLQGVMQRNARGKTEEKPPKYRKYKKKSTSPSLLEMKSDHPDKE